MTPTTMRAKLQIGSIEKFNPGTEYYQEQLTFHGVCKSDGYGTDGSDEDNTFAKFSPSVNLHITIANPALHGKFEVGQKFYVDFTPA